MAKPFTFPLDALLRIRRTRRDQHRRIVAEAARAARAVEEGIERIEREIDECGHALRLQRAAPRQDVESLRAGEWYVARLRNRLVELRAEFDRKQHDLDARRASLAEVAKAHRVIEALRDRHRARYDRIARRTERVEEDEVAVTAYLRQMRETQETQKE